MTLHYTQLCQTQLITLRVQHRFDDEVKDDAHDEASSSFIIIPSDPTSSVEGRDTCMDLENFYVTPCFSHDYHLIVVEYIKPPNTESACTTREKETDRDTFFFQKK
jgi:hypothetical protein